MLPITPADDKGSFRIGDDEDGRVECPFASVQRGDFSPTVAGRTMIFAPRILAASKACNGWPNSSMSQLVTSTTLLMARRPTDSRSRFNHAGLGPIFTPRTAKAV